MYENPTINIIPIITYPSDDRCQITKSTVDAHCYHQPPQQNLRRRILFSGARPTMMVWPFLSSNTIAILPWKKKGKLFVAQGCGGTTKKGIAENYRQGKRPSFSLREFSSHHHHTVGSLSTPLSLFSLSQYSSSTTSTRPERGVVVVTRLVPNNSKTGSSGERKGKVNF